MTDSYDTGLLPSELDPERPSVVETPWGTLAIYCVDGSWVAADAWCPHMLGPLHQGTRSGSHVVCPWHGWRFDLATGRRVDDPAQRDPTERLSGETSALVLVLATHVGANGRLSIEPPAEAR